MSRLLLEYEYSLALCLQQRSPLCRHLAFGRSLLCRAHFLHRQLCAFPLLPQSCHDTKAESLLVQHLLPHLNASLARIASCPSAITAVNNMQVSESNINISPSNYEHVRLSSVDSATTSSSSSQASSDGSHILSSGTLSESALSLSPFTSPPTTPRSPLPPSRLYHRFTSHEQLSSLARGHKRDWESTSDGLNDAEDKFTQLPIPSSRERRSSSVTLSSHHSARSRRSLANLRKSLVFNNSGIDEELSSSTPKGLLTPQSGSIEGPRLSRKHIEASRRSAREALEEDLRNLETEGSRNDDFVCKWFYLLRISQLQIAMLMTSQ